MFNNSEEVLKYISDEKVEYVDIRFCDLPGVMQHLTVPAAAFDQSFIDSGIAFDGSSVRGFQAINESDMALFPDAATARLDPFRKHKTLNMNFFVHDPITGEPYSRDPRNVARKAEQYLASTGIADTCYFGAEAEFYIFDSVRFKYDSYESFHHIDSVEGWWNTGREEVGGNLGYKVPFKGGYFPVPPVDHYADLRDDMATNLTNAGFELERGHHEVGTAGQAEINYKFNTLLHSADDIMLFKYIVKNTAWHAGKTVTFMPKPLFGDNGSGMHAHQSLWKDGQPLFHDEAGYGGLSDMARYYIGGLLHHAPSLLAFTNPTVNSYHRLVPGFEAPVNLVYSARNRSACIRIPLLGQQPQGQAPGVPLPRLVGQPVPGLRGDDDGRHGRHQEQDRAARPDRQGPLRAPAGGGQGHPAGSGQPGGGHQPPRGRPRLPARGRRVHARTSSRRGSTSSARTRSTRCVCVRTRTSSRCTTTCDRSAA